MNASAKADENEDISVKPLSHIEKANLSTYLETLIRKSIQYFLDKRNPNSGLIPDRALNTNLIRLKDLTPADSFRMQKMCSVATTGYGFTAMVLAVEKGMLKREIAEKLTLDTLKFVDKHTAPLQKGWLYHFMNGDTGEPYGDSEVSSVDTALFYLGAFAAAEYFGGKVKTQVKEMYDKIDFKMMLTNNGKQPDKLTFSHGFHVAEDEGHLFRHFINYNYSKFSEAIMVPFLALGSTTTPVPEEVWTKGWDRTKSWKEDGLETFDQLPLFTSYYPLGFLNLKGKVDSVGDNFWESAKNAVALHIKQCSPTYPKGIFGITACDGPRGYKAYSPGHLEALKPEDSKHRLARPVYKFMDVLIPDKTIAPPAIIAALPFAETYIARNSIPMLKKMDLTDYKYGLACAYELKSNWIAPDAVGIDVGSTLLMMDAYQAELADKQGLIHGLVAKNEVIQRAMHRAGFKKAA